ncbi:MAG: CDP-diacylglycerol--glycerol-3-phosphate 3-phosphatidyltransferase [Rickettsiales bacterium]|jgi:CDP-diacylglycerol--glycerol-3-phosphate 3-phosphatidyltransferase|nr:CDP-diacylglycerol--glycerol-3-phosphate 3-phosphatidyltransferase [Rickettsiales bacterium]
MVTVTETSPMDMSKLPNLLTLARVILIPVIVVSFYVPWKITNLVVAALFMLASITDYFDGYFARLYKVQTRFGRCFDPIADKLVTTVSLFMIVSFNDSIFILIPSIIIVCREILVSGLREFLGSLSVELPVTKLAKYKTALQMVAITALLLASKNSSHTYETLMNFFEVEPFLRIFFNGFIEGLGIIFLNIAALFTVITGYIYLKLGLKSI